MHILYTSVHPAAAAAPTVPGGSDHVWRAPRLPHCKQWELAGPFCSVTAKKQKHKITTKKYQCNVLGRQMTNETNKTFYSFLKKTHGMNLFFFKCKTHPYSGCTLHLLLPLTSAVNKYTCCTLPSSVGSFSNLRGYHAEQPQVLLLIVFFFS